MKLSPIGEHVSQASRLLCRPACPGPRSGPASRAGGRGFCSRLASSGSGGAVRGPRGVCRCVALGGAGGRGRDAGVGGLAAHAGGEAEGTVVRGWDELGRHAQAQKLPHQLQRHPSPLPHAPQHHIRVRVAICVTAQSLPNRCLIAIRSLSLAERITAIRVATWLMRFSRSGLCSWAVGASRSRVSSSFG
jgi:hypothetical protein